MSPGVVVTTATQSGPAAPLRTPSGQFFIVGLTERGFTDKANLIRGMADYERLMGSRVAYGSVYDQLKVYFDEGGRQAYVSRVVGPAATKGTLTLQDRAGAPVATLRVDASSEGAWSTQLTVEVQDGTVANTFRIIVRLNGTIVEDVTNIANPAEAVQRFAQSPYVKVTDLGSATAATNNNPAVLAATALSAGADDRASITTTHYVNALADFVLGLGDGAVAIPGQTGATIWGAIRDHCIANRRVGILAATLNETKANLITQAASLDSEYIGLFAPWITVSDGGFGTRNLSPEGYVAACRARAHERVGPWRVPAGELGVAETVLDLTQDFIKTDADDLDSAKVSVIRKVANSIRLYGWNSLSTNRLDYQFLKDRDLLNRLVTDAEARLEQFVFAPIDVKGKLLSSINAELVGMVDPIATAGGLYARIAEDGFTVIDPGYKVVTDSSNNSEVSLANNEVHARLLVRISPVGSLVSLNIVKVGVLSGV